MSEQRVPDALRHIVVVQRFSLRGAENECPFARALPLLLERVVDGAAHRNFPLRVVVLGVVLPSHDVGFAH